jgi:hypothetical protein
MAMSDFSGREKPKMLNDVVTDTVDCFAQGGPAGQAGGMSCGGEHEREAELQRESLKQLAGKVAEVVAAEGFPRRRLIAAKGILGSLQAVLPARVRDALARAEAGDLTKMPFRTGGGSFAPVGARKRIFFR